MDLGTIPMYWTIVCCVTAVKLLLLASYKSTDFEVHRNWLAITHSIERDKWYFEKTSQWTLDYPPFFAWFEYGLTYFASFFDTEMLKISCLPYESKQTIWFQRLSVIVTDFVYAFAVYRFCNAMCRKPKTPKKDFFADDRFILCMMLMTNIGLLMVDHIHFQYNGFLYGILLLSLLCVLKNRLLEAAFWFTVLLNFKHIFLYMAPAYFIYLLRNYCFRRKAGGTPEWTKTSFVCLLKLGWLVLVIFSLSFGPFILDGYIMQVIGRLFPFKRGLTHTYWAPNFWALYNSLDKVLTFMFVKMSIFDPSIILRSTMTSGIAKEYRHTLLPSISPLMCSILSAVFMLPGLIVLWRRPDQPMEFLRSLVLCAFSSFMFGWHVHEKAILMIIIPLSILAMVRCKEANIFLIVSTVGHFSIMPLLHENAESPTKFIMFAMFTAYAFFSISLKYRQPKPYPLPLLTILETVYLIGLLVVQLYVSVLHDYVFHNSSSYPFFPLMLTSTYCGIGTTYAFAHLSYIAWNYPLHYEV